MVGDRWGPDGPPDEAYSRVSDPGRYLALHAVADELVARLRQRFRVTAQEAEPTGPWRDPQRATRLVPEGPGVAVTVVWTGPGIGIRAGHAFERGFPVCGCDACDEDPVELAGDLEETLDALVGGGLVESRRRRRLGADETTVALRSDAGSWSSSGRLTEPDDPRHAIPAGTTVWPPWPPR